LILRPPLCSMKSSFLNVFMKQFTRPKYIERDDAALHLLDATDHAGVGQHILALPGAGLIADAGQIILRRLSSGNGIDTTAAIWSHTG
jgi:hypothetical protein